MGNSEKELFEHIKIFHQDIISKKRGRIKDEMKQYFNIFMREIISRHWRKVYSKSKGGICLTCGQFICGSILQHKNLLNPNIYCKIINKKGVVAMHRLGEKLTVL